MNASDAQGGLFGEPVGISGDGDARLAEAYVGVGRTLDDLPYTPEFDELCARAGIDPSGEARRAALHRLQNLRKAGRLARVGKAPSSPVRLSEEETELLASLVVEACGSMGQRDQLPYSARFDALVDRFNQAIGRHLSPHDVWRVVARLAK